MAWLAREDGGHADARRRRLGLCAGLDFSGEDPACAQQRFILMINATLENALARQTVRYVIPVRAAGATMAIMSATGTAVAIMHDHSFWGPHPSSAQQAFNPQIS